MAIEALFFSVAMQFAGIVVLVTGVLAGIYSWRTSLFIGKAANAPIGMMGTLAAWRLSTALPAMAVTQGV